MASNRIMIPACVWAMEEIIPHEENPRYQLQFLRFHGIGKHQRAVTTDGRILVVASWEEDEPQDFYIPKDVASLIRGSMKGKPQASGSRPELLVQGFANVLDSVVTLKIANCNWSMSFPALIKGRYPDYEAIAKVKGDSVGQQDYCPKLLGRLCNVMDAMNVTRTTWNVRNDAPCILSGTVEDSGVRVDGYLMYLVESKATKGTL